MFVAKYKNNLLSLAENSALKGGDEYQPVVKSRWKRDEAEEITPLRARSPGRAFLKSSEARLKKTPPFRAGKRLLSGFTMLETVVAISIGATVMVSLLAVSTSGLRHVRIAANEERLHAAAVTLTDTFTYWVKQARELEAPNSETLIVTLTDSSQKTFAKNGDSVTLNGVPVIQNGVTSAGFTIVGKSARLQISLLAGSENYDLSTTVTKRR